MVYKIKSLLDMLAFHMEANLVQHAPLSNQLPTDAAEEIMKDLGP